MLAKQLKHDFVNSKNIIAEVEKPGKSEMWSYGLGSFGIFSVWTLLGAFLTFYYTDVAGLAATSVGTLMLVARLFDGITDFGMGSLVDMTKSKHGKARPWLLWMSFPLGATTILLFSVPNISDSGKIIYAYATYLIFILLYTAVSIPYKTLLGVMTQDQNSRSQANVYAGIFIMTGTLVVMTLTQPLAAAIGWTMLAVLYGLITVVALYVTFRKVKERSSSYANGQIEKVSAKQGFIALTKNKYWLIITVYCIAFYATTALTQGAALYYSQWVLGNLAYFPLYGLAVSLPMLLGMFFLTPLVKRFGKRNLAIFGSLLYIVAQLVKMTDPTSLTVFLTGSALAGIGAIPAIALLFAMINDTVEYGEYKSGVRTEGLVNSGASFGIKVGTGLGLALIGWLLGFGGYVGGAAEQSALSIQMILALNLYIPLGLAVLQLILMFLFKLDKEYPVVLAELQKRKVMKM
ncbi:glycoside/pentoside/hexuronide:cation symporter, GPH family [Mesobacillus persicus]|uniref:Glycoside/pentoside/hexuronide:cation symporter, GPH family n=1 Tax=Mesobacillus persicus TaxID=930146 RepID=A0A1H8G6J5_9BACI|nr:glycoside-pentoside-hexuronide (GPH):cation symporter [Mesobacillus persicus]SEN39374.1 glycoside/pentoside/hexuronide:cation symporter, GPH family [Mesobacillus persicus]